MESGGIVGEGTTQRQCHMITASPRKTFVSRGFTRVEFPGNGDPAFVGNPQCQTGQVPGTASNKVPGTAIVQRGKKLEKMADKRQDCWGIVGLGSWQKRSNERLLGTGLQFRAVIVTVEAKTCLCAVPIGLRAVDGLLASVRPCVYWPALEGSDLRIRGGVSVSKEPEGTVSR